VILPFLATTALATAGFDPSAGLRMTGDETYTQDGTLKLWSALERHVDPDRSLLRPEAFNSGTAWADTDYSPHIAAAFGTSDPHSASFLLHMGLNEEVSRGTPILLVPGAGDNGSRGFITLATRLDRNLLRPVYALTFAHPHGDVFMQAEAVANAITVIRDRTGASKVDLVAHSKGGVAATVYTSNLPGTDWGQPDYAEVGTQYREDVRRLVLVAAPLAGVDSSYRWSALNLAALDADSAVSPTSWARYYPNTTAVPLVFDDLRDQDLLPDGLDLFPGQRQLVARQPYPLPGTMPFLLGGYALQPDWYTSYEGGLGLLSRSDGIDAAVAAGGGLIGRLRTAGVHPDVRVWLLAGANPLMPNGDAEFQEAWSDLAGDVNWGRFLDDLSRNDLQVDPSAEEIDGLERGALILGEVTGPSDGLVFVSSALAQSAVDARGARIVDSALLDLSHLDLLYASPITGHLLVDAGEAGGPEDQWMIGVGRRYTAEDSLGWIQDALEEAVSTHTPIETDTGTVEVDTGSPASENVGRVFDPARPCGGCASGTPPSASIGWLLALALARRRR
jgi:triacylglycerol lipase